MTSVIWLKASFDVRRSIRCCSIDGAYGVNLVETMSGKSGKKKIDVEDYSETYNSSLTFYSVTESSNDNCHWENDESKCDNLRH